MEDFEHLSAKIADRYEIEAELAHGGMATVYLAEDVRHGRKVAVKVLRPEITAMLGPDRFLREIDIAAKLAHPHILPLYDSGNAGGILYYVMPFVEGESLRSRLDREGALPVTDAIRIVRDVVDALAYAHRHGVVHRDIKPDNVMLASRHALVTDFGVAKAVNAATGPHHITTAGHAVGTPQYMAPEQAAAEPKADPRSDIYALGVMAYELLAGRPPLAGATARETLAAHVSVRPRPLTDHCAGIPQALCATIMRCLEKRPDDRWQSAEELLAELESFLEPGTAAPPVQASTAPASSIDRGAGLQHDDRGTSPRPLLTPRPSPLATRWALSWAALTAAFAVHVLDEWANDFLTYYNPNAERIQAWLGIPLPPTFTLGEWLGGLAAVIVLLALLTPFVRPGRPWAVIAAYIYAFIHVANATSHVIISIAGQWLAPGVFSSPLLFAAAVWLIRETNQVRNQASPQAHAPAL